MKIYRDFLFGIPVRIRSIHFFKIENNIFKVEKKIENFLQFSKGHGKILISRTRSKVRWRCITLTIFVTPCVPMYIPVIEAQMLWHVFGPDSRLALPSTTKFPLLKIFYKSADGFVFFLYFTPWEQENQKTRLQDAGLPSGGQQKSSPLVLTSSLSTGSNIRNDFSNYFFYRFDISRCWG